MSINKRKDGRWKVSYRDHDGRLRSTTFPKGKAGKKRAEKFQAEIQYSKAHERPLPQSRQEGIYLDELLQEWAEAKKAQGCSLQWIRDWLHIFNTYLSEPLTRSPAHTITQNDIIQQVNAHWADRTQTTRNRYLEYLKTLFEFGIQRGYFQVNPLHGWKKGKEQRRSSKLTLDDLKRIQNFALQTKFTDKQGKTRTYTSPPAAHLAWAIDVAWNIPVRPGQDLYGLVFDSVSYDKQGIEIYHSKVNKRAFVRLSEDFLRDVWVKQQTHSQYLIEYKGLPVKSLKRALKFAAQELKLGYEVTMYDIRHLWITTALDQGLEMSAIAYIAGTSVEMIQRNYYEPHRAEKNRAVEIMPKLEKGKQNGKVISIGSK